VTINDVPEVVIDALGGGYKFIVARLTDERGSERIVIRADEKLGYHDDLLRALRREVLLVEPAVPTVRCFGGGRIEINPDQKTIRIWDSSAAFGEEPDRQQTVQMLQTAFPDFQITAI